MKTKALLLGAASATAVSACATTTSPTGRTQYVGAVSQEQLNQLGEQAFLQAKSKTPQSRDGRQNAYVGCVVDAIVRQLPPQWRQLRWEEALFADQETNAWALPGGKVGVNDGIFKAARNQDQLAGVIAHEIGHVVSRHHDERITRQALASGVLQVGGAVAGARYGEGVGSAVTQGGGIFAQAGEYRLAVVAGRRIEDADVPWPPFAKENGREAVDRYQKGRPPGRCPCIQRQGNRIMEGRPDGLLAGLPLRR